MNLEEIREHCMAKPGVTECLPFDEHTLVFKVAGKMFLLMALDSNPVEINAKCDPEKAIELRENYSVVKPGYHMNKTHWNTITCKLPATKKLIFEWIDHSYELVVSGLSKKLKEELTTTKPIKSKKFRS